MIRSAFMMALLLGCVVAFPGCGGDADDTQKDASVGPAKDGGEDSSKDSGKLVAPPRPPVFQITGEPGFDSPEKAIAFVADCLKSGEFEKFWPLAVTVDDVQNFNTTAALLKKEADVDVLEKSQLGLYLFKMTRANMERHERSWRSGFETARGELDFTQAVRGGTGGTVSTEGELKWMGNASVFFTLDDRNFELKIGKLLLTPRGWLILDDDPLKLKEITVDEAS